MTCADVVIVGAGHGGAQAAIALRQRKFEGSILVVGDDPHLPYERPPLSKDYLSGERPFDSMVLRPKAFWRERQIELLLGEQVTAVVPREHRVALRSGETIGYERLIWAAGGTPRKLSCSGANVARLHSIRNRADVDRIMAELPNVENVVIIGGGYIGLESAAVFRKLGLDVVVLESQDRVLGRVAGEPVSRFYETEHRAHGVKVRTGVTVERIEASDGTGSAVHLGDGQAISAGMVIVGIGIIPNVQPLAAAGATVSNGVHIDQYCRTTLPDVFAIGDCALFQSRHANGDWIRLESVQNANDQAQVVARYITGDVHPYEALPWFWSNQYDLRLQTVGLSSGHDNLVIRGEPASRSFSAVYLRQGKVIALDCINNAKDYVQGRALIESGSPVDPAELADHSKPLAELLRRARQLP